MPRAPGQIDRVKTQAILAAAGQVFGERGLAASMEEIARRAMQIAGDICVYTHHTVVVETLDADR